jgi:hypothetical protein
MLFKLKGKTKNFEGHLPSRKLFCSLSQKVYMHVKYAADFFQSAKKPDKPATKSDLEASI